jgi:uncharacterized protein DUF2330
MFRRIGFVVAAVLGLAGIAAPAMACGGLIGPNGAVNLLRTSTLAGYHDGVEHYITAFKFAGGGGAFGSLIPLPGIPTSIVRGGDWTLQRLERETAPVGRAGGVALTAAAGDKAAQVIQEVRIDALDITVLKGGGDEVGIWAKQNGFRLPPDAPEVLDFYAKRSPIFLAARFDADAARKRGQSVGDGTPVHLAIPTSNPWVPLRILALGKQAAETVDADVYLMTDREPSLLPEPGRGLGVGLFLNRSEPASTSLMRDLRTDKGMEWMPQYMWLTYIRIGAQAKDLSYDLAVGVNGKRPSAVAAGLAEPGSEHNPAVEPKPATEHKSPFVMVTGALVAVFAAAAGAVSKILKVFLR